MSDDYVLAHIRTSISIDGQQYEITGFTGDYTDLKAGTTE